MNDLEQFLELPDVPRPEPTEPWELYRWTQVADGNLDELPDGLCPTENCPTCGAAWVDLVAVGWKPEIRPQGIRGELDRDRWRMRVIGGDIRPVAAVRLICHGDHRVDYDGSRLWPLPALPSWSAAVIGLGAMLIAAYIPAFMGWAKK